MSTALTGQRKTATYLHLVRELLYNIDWPSGRLLTYWHFVHVQAFCARVTYILLLSRLQVRGTLGVGLTIRLPRGISVSYITKNPINYFCDSHVRIHLLVLPGIINSSASRSTNLCITKTSVTCGRIYAYPLKHPFVTAYGGSAKSNTNLYKVI